MVLQDFLSWIITTMFVFAVDQDKRPLGLVSPKNAKIALQSGAAVAFHRQPFVILAKDQVPLWDGQLILKVDPGYTTGIAIVSNDCVLWAAQIKHRPLQVVKGLLSRAALRRSRRGRKTPYREARWLNRRRPVGWLPPSTVSLLSNIVTWATRICSWCPISEIWVESIKFDQAKKMNPSIKGEEYQQGLLRGYRNVRDYLLATAEVCCYCGRVKGELRESHKHCGAFKPL